MLTLVKKKTVNIINNVFKDVEFYNCKYKFIINKPRIQVTSESGKSCRVEVSDSKIAAGESVSFPSLA
jgi:hypothetical protein